MAYLLKVPVTKPGELNIATGTYEVAGTQLLIAGTTHYVGRVLHVKTERVISFHRPIKVNEDEVIFRGLADKWKRETGDFSVISRRYNHRSYRAILEMGASVIPLILKDLRRDPDRWFHALEFLTKKNPAKGASTFYEAVDRWIAWGISEGHIS
jgi:hypothetical protein